MSDVRVGTSGWNYPTGRGTWNGVFYPPRKGRPHDFDELTFYAEHFNTVEVNSTFYGQPRPEVTSAWAQRTPPGFEFSVKLYQKFTHPRLFRERVVKALPAGSASSDAAVQALATPNQADLDEFLRGIEPLAERGKLGALLAQFPASFKDGNGERQYLDWLLNHFRNYPVAVELRHRSWSDDVSGTLELLNAHRAAWVQIDEPKFRLSIRQNYLPNIKGFYYMRLHGRNAAQWWKHDKSEDRYNYLYTSDELREFTDTIGAVRQIVRKAYVYANNHFSAQSVANAAMIKQQLGEPIEGIYSPEFVAAFPDLKNVVQAARNAMPLFTRARKT